MFMNMQTDDYTHLQHECQALLAAQAGVVGVVAASADGFDVASAVTQGLEPAKIAAMASSIAAIGHVVSQEASLGEGKSVTVTTDSGFVYITQVVLNNSPYVINVIANASAVLAQIIYQCGSMKKRLEQR